MPYFPKFPTVEYAFGNEDFKVETPNLVAYADAVDAVKENGAVYQEYYIKDGTRPDTLSQELYGTPSYHWSFFLLNDHLREQGWPLSHDELTNKIQDTFPNTVITTRDTLDSGFQLGSTITGQTSNESGEIIRRNVSMGQLFVEGSIDFVDSEQALVTEDGTIYTIDINSAVAEYNAVHHYTDSGVHVDIDPYVGPGGNTPVTYTEYYTGENEALRTIKVFRPEVMRQVAQEFKRVMKE